MIQRDETQSRGRNTPHKGHTLHIAHTHSAHTPGHTHVWFDLVFPGAGAEEQQEDQFTLAEESAGLKPMLYAYF